MGLVEQVKAARPVGKKGFLERPFWDAEAARYAMYATSSWSAEREQVDNDFAGYVDGIYKRSGPIAALIVARMMVFSEARFMFRALNDYRPGALYGGPGLALLQQPWAGGTTRSLLARMEQDASLAGNAFVVSLKGRLRRLRPDWVTIISASEMEPDLYGNAIDAEVIGYLYEPQGQQGAGSVLLTPDQVAHYAPIPDPGANWRGMSWISPALEEVSADRAATRHKLKFFQNGASPQVVVSYDATVGFETYKKYKDHFDKSSKGVDNAYKTIHLGGGADAKVVGADLRQLDFKSTQGAGETRLASLAGVPPVIVGFSEGLAGSSLNEGNFKAARRRFADATLRPLWGLAAGSLATLVPVPAGAELWYDERNISFLREDAADQAAIVKEEMLTVESGVRAGFEPESVVAAVTSGDLTLMVHTGLYSVQLQKPETGTVAKTPPKTLQGELVAMKTKLEKEA